ncbi:hypothetical protein BHM03_00033060 [Ensete ventricosum]|nr:hypothetical protein BHM03_00033060 [Ensete ventricosum]
MSREGLDHAEVYSGATRSSNSVNNTTARRTMDSRSECHGTAGAGLSCLRIDLALDESLGHQHMGAIGIIRVAGEWDYSSAYIRLREPGKLEDKADRWSKGAKKRRRVQRSSANPKAKRRSERTRRSATVPQRQIYRSRRKGRKYKATDSRAMGLAAPWYRIGGTSVKSLIPCSHGRRVLVVKGAEKVENTEANSKYQDKIEGQRLENFIRPVSTGFSSR